MAQVCARTGWTWDYVWDRVTVPQLEALYRQWRLEPTAEVLLGVIARGLGWQPSPEAQREAARSQAGGIDVRDLGEAPLETLSGAFGGNLPEGAWVMSYEGAQSARAALGRN